MSKATIAYTNGFSENDRPRSFWPTIGAAWKIKNGAYSINIGRQSKDKETGEVKERFESVTLKPGDRLYLQPNSRKVEGSKSPDYFVALVQDDEKEAK